MRIIFKIVFYAVKPLEKQIRDVREFKVCNDKINSYSVMNLYNREIVSYIVTLSYYLNQTREMLKGAFDKFFDDIRLAFLSSKC